MVGVWYVRVCDVVLVVDWGRYNNNMVCFLEW